MKPDEEYHLGLIAAQAAYKAGTLPLPQSSIARVENLRLKLARNPDELERIRRAAREASR